jgi:ABC-type multidrug transport system fused ATPase/permease subunit
MTWARFVWRYVSCRKDLLAALVACAVVMAGAELSIPWLIKEAIDAVLDERRAWACSARTSSAAASSRTSTPRRSRSSGATAPAS